MKKLSQNKKIALSAIIVFFLSFAGMVFFLDGQLKGGAKHGKADIISAEVVKPKKELKKEGTENKYREIIENRNEPILVANSEGMIIFVSNDACELLNESCEDLNKTLFFDHFNTEDLAQFASEYSKLLQESKKKEGMGPYRIRNKVVLISAHPIVDGKKVTEIAFVLKDLTEQIESLRSESTWMRGLYPKIRELG